MEGRLRSTVLKLSGQGTYLHFVSIRNYSKFGCQATFRGEQEGSLYHVCYFSRPVLQVNTLANHLNSILALYRSLNSKIVTPVLEVLQEGEALFVVSRGYEWTVEALVQRREGLSEFQIAYFLVDLMELMSYLRSRDCLLEKVELQDLFLNQSQKITISFGLFLNAVNQKPVLRSLPFRNECRNRNNCPDLFLKPCLALPDIDQVNAWNIGILLYELLLNARPFSASNEDLIAQSKSCQCAKDLHAILRKEYSLNAPRKEENPQLAQLVTELLRPVAEDRLKFNLIVIHPFLKKFPTPPHILPTTIFSCPPSEGFKEQYFKKFLVEERRAGELRENRTNTQHSGMLRSQKEMQHQEELEVVRGEKQFRTQMELQSSQRTLSESSAFIEEFVDISDSLGFGYQMNSGLVCFVFNDQTEYYYPSGSQKEIRARQRSRKGAEVVFQHDKLPEQEQVRKKIHILEAFQKTLKRTKSSVSQKERLITVSQYCRTKYASLFLLSNDTVQVFFNDKMGFLLSKNSILFQPKNTDHFEQYDFTKEDRDLEVRKDYCLTVARKIFLWKNFPEQRILDSEGLIEYET